MQNRIFVVSIEFVVAVLLSLFHTSTQAADVHCQDGWLGVRAEIIRIKPPSDGVRKQPGDGKLHENDVLCEGDTLIVPSGIAVELYEEGKAVTHTGDYKIKGGAAALTAKAAEYLKIVFAVVSPDTPPSRPTSTSVRGTQDIPNSEKATILAISPLRDLTQQSLVVGLQPVASWRDGSSAFTCEILNGSAEILWTSEAIKGGWCLFPRVPDQTARLRVRDARKRSIGWNVKIVEWREVPRPDWIDRSAGARSRPQDATAWAIWLWKEGDAQWRMQSLAMLNDASGSQWLAGYFIDHVLAENPPISASQEETP
jgi:hypothetical protein